MQHRIKYLLFLFFVICFVCSLQADLLEIYKKGTVTLEPDPEFGKTTDNDSLFYDNCHYVAVAPDGRVYVSNSKENNIHIFDKKGNLLKTFGQKGEGPGI